MSRLNLLIRRTSYKKTASNIVSHLSVYGKQKQLLPPLPSQHLAQLTSNRFLDFYQLGNKEAIEKERARLADEMNRGYFADMSELKQHGGKIAKANKVMIPAAVAVKFPDLNVTQPDGTISKLPISCNGKMADPNTLIAPVASLVCLSFRANSQAMIDSWSGPFFETFSDRKNVHLYEVSLIDTWLLCLDPMKWFLLRFMKKPNRDGREHALRRQFVYSFGDHYYFRKELKILNLLTGYIFLLDKFGRIRWQGFGLATEEELSSLLSCTHLLLGE